MKIDIDRTIAWVNEHDAAWFCEELNFKTYFRN